MDEIAFPFWIVFQLLDDRFVLAEAVGFPDISRLGERFQRATDHLRRNVKPILEKLPLAALFRRHIRAEPEPGRCRLELVPATGSVLWREPLSLAFDYL